MGFIKGFLVVVVSVLLFLSIFSMTFTSVFSSSLKYENVQENSVVTLENLLDSELNLSRAIGNSLLSMQKYCKNNSKLDYVFSSEGYTFSIPCNVSLSNKSEIIKKGISNFVYDVYFKDYDCGFWECLKKSPFDEGYSTFIEVLISEKAYTYWTNNFYFFLGLSSILAIALFILVEKKSNSFILTGGMLIISSIIFIKISSILPIIFNNVLLNLNQIFFSESYHVSLTILVVGVIFLLVGLVLKIFKIGFKINDLVSKFKKSKTSESLPEKTVKKSRSSSKKKSK